MGAPGCDDASMISVQLGTVARDITLVMPYYENPEMLKRQVRHLSVLAEGDKNLFLIIVDDGSPSNPAGKAIRQWNAIWPPQCYTHVFRIEKDVRWNWLAARNIGVKHAKTDWVVLTDMDHMIPFETFRTLAYGEFRRDIIYRFSRTGTKTHPHPNSWFMTREMYWRVGGYDEALSGHYGTDGEYRRRCAATAPIRIMDAPLELHEHEGDSSTVAYKRKQPEDTRVKQLIKARRPGWKPKVLSFPYHEVQL